MKRYDFPAEQTCPLCQARFGQAERRTEYDPVIVVVCPSCTRLLWLPGLDAATSSLYPFDPDADAGGL